MILQRIRIIVGHWKIEEKNYLKMLTIFALVLNLGQENVKIESFKTLKTSKKILVTQKSENDHSIPLAYKYIYLGIYHIKIGF